MTVDPASLKLQIHPAACLREKCKPVEVDDELRAIAARMIEVMRSAEGIGLAAPQVGLGMRIFVCHVPPEGEGPPADDAPIACAEPEVFINPEILAYEGPPEPYEEGCLSLPGILGEVRRPPVVRVRALGLDGTEFERRAGGLLGRCWQHEIDHLDGVMIIDKMTQMSRLKNRTALKQLERRGRRGR
ncbi:MAG: peptide deformylase [Phycisphaeraceae bacterium]|nr:MAG: peptide deformylase [Phycisphaeraceae bacterium]